METELTSYEITKVECEKKDCNESFNVIISPIQTVVAIPAQEIEIKGVVKTGSLITDYIVAKCICGHYQRVYLKTKKKDNE